ncbi:LPXTG cell wall anchor domain-containing protein [Streptomyces sp. P9-A4]|uniref:LPXTG cell wall anchor domain-containing protein n=1 Tax=Streptomyces sp. P9-A4 TaxID=3072285 RepID=UPI002FCA33A1
MRRSLIPAAALVAAMAGSLALAPVAFASNGPKGDNGTVKIHDSKTGEEIKANEPKVCAFYLDAFNFDAQQKANWRIEAWANNDQEKGTEVEKGSITLDAKGHGRTEDLKLADGQYKLFWNFDGENGKAKHKVFKVDCPDETPGTETPGTPGTETPGTPGTETPGTPGTETPGTETPGTPGTETPGTETPGTPGTETPGTETPAPSETPGGTESPSATTPAGETGGNGGTGGKDGNLAETGSSAPVGILAAAALALAAAGAFLVTRRRKAQQH